jgi:3-oxoacyl-[acyl-carrier protein] reductase
MEDMRFKEKVVVVTGSTRGIGKEIARAFARQGAAVIILGRNAESARQAAKEIVQTGFRAEGFACDVTNLAQVREIINKILDKHSRIDILVNNAGMTKDNLLLRMSESDWDEVMSVNLRGAFNFTKAAAKAMLKAQNGKIINISSIIGMTGNAGQANYAASKAGMIGFTKSVARELASRGITANAIAPGYIQTDMTARLKDAVRDEILKTIPLGRLGDASDVANACLFLASADADYITGQTLMVDGGMAI